MRTLDTWPAELAARVQTRDFVPVVCDCGVTFAWHVSRGEIASCPGCKTNEQVPLNPVYPKEMSA
jgi:hypothetical protein